MVKVPGKNKIRQIVELLRKQYGTREWRLNPDPLTVLVQTILSQNTSDTNAGRAFQNLLSCFNNWQIVADAEVPNIANCIKSGGLARIKAQRIKGVLNQIIRKRGQLELDFLSRLAPSDAEGWLLELPGVGLKTARCVLLFSLGMPVLPVDTHIWRVTKRLGLIDSEITLNEAHKILGNLVPPDEAYLFHVVVIEHGRRICRARNPDCSACILNGVCASYVQGVFR